VRAFVLFVSVSDWGGGYTSRRQALVCTATELSHARPAEGISYRAKINDPNITKHTVLYSVERVCMKLGLQTSADDVVLQPPVLVRRGGSMQKVRFHTQHFEFPPNAYRSIQQYNQHQVRARS
jgi:hypothetical protein